MTPWEIKGTEFVNCNCAYGCPCQFNALPTHGFCEAVGALHIHRGPPRRRPPRRLKAIGVFKWPGPIHQGSGSAFMIIDKRASEAQRQSLLRILIGRGHRARQDRVERLRLDAGARPRPGVRDDRH